MTTRSYLSFHWDLGRHQVAAYFHLNRTTPITIGTHVAITITTTDTAITINITTTTTTTTTATATAATATATTSCPPDLQRSRNG